MKKYFLICLLFFFALSVAKASACDIQPIAQNYLKDQKRLFNEYYFLKPKSTRTISKEFFVIGKNFKA
jgi:hypothetical protein